MLRGRIRESGCWPWLAAKTAGEWRNGLGLIGAVLRNKFLPAHYVGAVGIKQAEAN